MQEPQSLLSAATRRRGKLILILGLVSATAVIFFFIVYALPWKLKYENTMQILGLLSILLGLSGISALFGGSVSLLDPKKRKARSIIIGMILGAIGAIFSFLTFERGLLRSIEAVYPDSPQTIDYDLNDLGNVALQYRFHSKGTTGGRGSYIGFRLPEKLAKRQSGNYVATVISADTILYEAKWAFDTTQTIKTKIDAKGWPVPGSRSRVPYFRKK
jgi:hypothetical protein